jgi:prepilin-type N-terminal cleavage/methylation domain-containing protein
MKKHTCTLAPFSKNKQRFGFTLILLRFWEKYFPRYEGCKLRSAFTLIELLVVIVIIGILATISVAQFNEYQEKARQAKSIAFAAQAEKKLMADATIQSLGSFIDLDFEGTNGEVIDTSINQQNITFTPSPNRFFSDDTPVGIGQSLELFEDTIYFGNIQAQQYVPTTNLAMSFFIKLKETSGHNFIFFSSGGGLTINNNDFRLQANSGWTADFNTNLQTDKWYHILVSYDSDKASLYLDGDLIRIKDVGDDFNFSAPSSQFRIGPPTTVTNFHILVDRLKVYPIPYAQD